MPFVHFACTFNAKTFLKIFQEKVLVAGEVRYDCLLAWATRVACDQSPERQSLLEKIGFVGGVLSAAEAKPSEFLRELFMIALVELLTMSSSLSGRQRESYYVLQAVLPELGWKDEDILRLVRGDSLDTLLERSSNPVLIKEFKGLRQYGGWLDSVTLAGFRKQLEEDQSIFLRPNDKLLRILCGASVLLRLDPSILLHRAYGDVLDMLRSPKPPADCLFLMVN